VIAEVQKHLSETVADQVLSVHGNVKFSAVDDSTLFHIYTETKVHWLVTRGVRMCSSLTYGAEFGVLCRIEENVPIGTENEKILLIFVNPFTYNG